MTRHLPRPAPLRRIRRGIASVPSGLPTTAAAMVAIVFVGAQLLTVVHALSTPIRPAAEAVLGGDAPEDVALLGPTASPAGTPRSTATPRSHATDAHRIEAAGVIAAATPTHHPNRSRPAGAGEADGSSASSTAKDRCPDRGHSTDDGERGAGAHRGHADGARRGSERGRERSCRRSGG